ncbi:SDR family NAD(P)-dependent oxidoreductase [Roseiterribacter gracilis]|uniref:Sorbitol 6-phosphate dehydrogenase n=1 Tax=Roseiterribacter gracilis TaxID=2812848 RepID=A0A8S8XH16_9PROT|nr:sorbitol 6-phosphate dehydrogenase [Rhodospirillales bacterium TMPK1]
MPTYPELAGKVAVITGAGRPKGLGEAMAKRLAAEGCRVVLHDLGKVAGDTAPAHGIGKEDELRQVAADIRAAGGECTSFQGDMMIEQDVANLVAHAVATYGRLDIFVNNAGIGYLFGPLTETTQAHWDAVLDVNLRGCFFGMKHAAKQMISQGQGGRIVSIASQAAKSGFAFAAAYSASKHGLVGLTRAAAQEFGAHKITVNAICPNHVTTGLGAWQNDFMSKARGQTIDEYLAAMRARIPLGRPGLVEDTANACAFLCSDQASYITGEAMNVSGGEEVH